MKRVLLGLLLLLSTFAWAQTYTETFYICATGDGSAPEDGTCAHAWDAADFNTAGNWDTDDSDDGKLGPNDLLIVLDDAGPIRAELVPRASGLEGKPITIRGEPGGSPKISGADLVSTWSLVSSYTTVASDTDGISGGLALRYNTGNTLSLNEWVATESFSLARISAYLWRVGTPSGTAYVTVYNDSGGTPNAEIGASDGLTIDAITTSSPGELFNFDFSTPVALTSDQTYYIGLKGDWSFSTSNYIRFRFTDGCDADFPARWTYSAWSEKTDYCHYMLVQKAGPANVWSASLAIEPTVVLFDGSFGIKDATGCPVNLDAIGEWCWASNMLYVYSVTDPDTAFTNPGIEAGARDKAYVNGEASYITLEDLTFEGANEYGVMLYTEGTITDIVIDSITATANGWSGLTSFSGGIQTGVTVRNSTFSYNGSYGIQVGVGAIDWLVEDSVTHHNGQVASDFGGGIKIGGSIVAQDPRGVIVQRCASYSNGKRANGAVIGDGRGYGIWLDINEEAVQYGHVVRNNIIYDNIDSGLVLEKTLYASVYYNISYDNTDCGLWISADDDGPEVSNNTIYNNTYYGNNIGICSWGGYSGEPNLIRNNLIKNNIAVDNTTRELSAKWGGENDGTVGSGNVYLNNCFGVEAANFIEWGTGVYKSTYDAWETAYGGTTSSVEADPLFLNAAGGDFRLGPNSPTINAGTDVSLTTDYYGLPISGNPDIGAIESESTGYAKRFPLVRLTVTTEANVTRYDGRH